MSLHAHSSNITAFSESMQARPGRPTGLRGAGPTGRAGLHGQPFRPVVGRSGGPAGAAWKINMYIFGPGQSVFRSAGVGYCKDCLD